MPWYNLSRGAPIVKYLARLLVFGSLAVLMGIVAAVAQDAGQATQYVGGLSFREEVEVTVANIEVFVRDKDGRPFEGLTIDDFEVYQDGRRRELTNFLLVNESLRPVADEVVLAAPTPIPEEAAPMVASATSSPVPEIKPIHVVVYIDNENLRPFDRNRVLGDLRRFLADTVRPGVEAMIVSYQGSVDIVQPFTSDRQALATALRDLRQRTGGRVNRDTEHNAMVREIDRMRYEEANRIGDDPLSSKASLVYEDLITYAERVSAETVRDLSALRQVGSMLTGLPGRKALVYVSSGLPMVPGKDLFWEFTQKYQAVSFNSLMARFNQQIEYTALTAAAAAQGLSFYTIDAQGMAPNSSLAADHAVSGDPTASVIADINYEEPLTFMAERTGGLATVGTNNFAGGFERLRLDLFTYYSLGYPITSAGGDRVHRIEVRVPKHPELDVRYRKTFVEKSLESQVQDRVMTALLFDIDDNQMGIDVTVGEARLAQDGLWRLPLRVGFPTSSIALLPEGENLTGEVVIFVSLRDGRGRQAAVQRRDQPIQVPRSEYDRLANLNLSVDIDLLVEEGNFRIAVGLMDRLTRQASFEVLAASAPGS